ICQIRQRLRHVWCSGMEHLSLAKSIWVGAEARRVGVAGARVAKVNAVREQVCYGWVNCCTGDSDRKEGIEADTRARKPRGDAISREELSSEQQNRGLMTVGEGCQKASCWFGWSGQTQNEAGPRS